ncbi:hypothetical protein CEXT_90051 [Caerostris extrusa]|uniref:Uncharacterized protein n=1 Tax=Caerostris extrusa TaxID=172846 RepID=A0AAV4WSH1_CAEEX|nr:hypothetical protein CEXT_90051 [Caerostris extrusa]
MSCARQSTVHMGVGSKARQVFCGLYRWGKASPDQDVCMCVCRGSCAYAPLKMRNKIIIISFIKSSKDNDTNTVHYLVNKVRLKTAVFKTGVRSFPKWRKTAFIVTNPLVDNLE